MHRVTFQSEVNMALSLKPMYRALFLTDVNAVLSPGTVNQQSIPSQFVHVLYKVV